ncbi:MAG: helix-turn-helix transcriptional regulator [Clostridia bacterium]|nr:helix-turn-helix transcriptional regulator [Clostridia bacterium]
MTFGEKLQHLRKARGWTQEELAQRVGVSRQSMSKWEGDAALPDTANVVVLADLFGVTMDYLLREDAGTSPAVSLTAEPAKVSSDRWTLCGRLLLGTGIAAMFALRLLASLYPVRYGINDMHYEGLWAYLLSNDLVWLWSSAVIAAVAGALLVCVRWLRRNGAQLKERWLQKPGNEKMEDE